MIPLYYKLTSHSDTALGWKLDFEVKLLYF